MKIGIIGCGTISGAYFGGARETARPHRASGSLAYHVLEVMCAFDKSSETGEHVVIKSTTERPEPLPHGLAEWEID